MLKVAKPEDRDSVVRLCKHFYNESPYNFIPFDEEYVTAYVEDFLQYPISERLVLLYNKDGLDVGVLAAVVSTIPLSPVKTTAEIVWYVLPAHRKSKAGLELKKAYEDWAVRVGSDYSQLVHLQDDNSPALSKLLKRNGYVPVEQGYIKELTWPSQPQQ